MAVVAVPTLVLAGVAGAGGQPTAWGDQAVIQLSTDRAASFHQLVGPYSRFGWSHPGPLWFYLLAGPYRALGGGSRALVVSGVVVCGAFAVLLVVLAGRAGGSGAGRWAAALAAVELVALGPGALARVWNPVAVVVPTAALLVAAAAVAAGRWWALPWVVGLGTFLVQTDVSTGLAVVAVGAGAVALAAVSPDRPAWPTAWRPGAVSAGVAAVLWLPPVVQEVTGRTGNLTAVARFFTAGHPGHRLGPSVDAVAGALWPPLRGGGRLSGSVAGLLVGTALAAGAIVAVAGVAEARRRRDEGRAGPFFAGALGALAALLVAAGIVSATRAVGPLFPYLTLWLSAAELAIGLGAAGLLGRAGRGLATGASLAAAVALGVTASVARPVPPVGGQQVASLWRAVAPTLPRGSLVRVEVASADRWPWAAGLVVELTHGGYRAVVDRPWLFLFGAQFDPAGARPAATLAVWRPGDTGHRPPGRLAATVGPTAVLVETGAGGPVMGP
ncbi:MAG TPA: hypothetical protein VFA11_07365 [Acidimicrobiales bacterium]|nr:hypothetical protein [Acidimicrobiales bacterium]